MLSLSKIKQDPLKYFPKFFLDSKRSSIATKTIKDELILLKDYSIKNLSYSQLFKKYNYSRKMIYRIFKQWGKEYPPNLTKVKRYGRRFSVLDDLKICKFYLDGDSIYIVSNKFKTDPKSIAAILKRYGFRLRTCLESSNLRYNKKQLKYPLSTYVPHLLKRGLKKYFPDFIAILTLTDGCCTPAGKLALKVRRPKLIYYGAPILCKVYIDLIKCYYNINPSVFNKRKDGTYQVIYERKDIKNKLLPHLLSYSCSYKTSPAHNQTKTNYLNKEQPSLDFLENRPKSVLIEALRLGFSAEGSCSPHINGKRIDSNLNFSCSHPILIKQFKSLLDEFNFSFKIMKNKEHWSELDGLRTIKLNDLKRFLEFGGFIEGVKVTKNSKYYSEFDKNLMVKAILEWNNRKRHLDNLKKPAYQHRVFHKFIKEEVIK